MSAAGTGEATLTTRMTTGRTISCVTLVAAMLTGDATLAPRAGAQERPQAPQQAAQPPGKLLKFVILSRHGVRSPIPSQAELNSWTTGSPWPVWRCPVKDDPNRVCNTGELTPQGRALAVQMGTYYGSYLSSLLPGNQCPDPKYVFFWSDVTERTMDTGLWLL